MATAEELSSAIEPGSLPYGERQGLEANLSAVTGGGQAPAGPPPAPPGGGVEPGLTDPLGMLLGGEIPPDTDPVTAGLSVGDGPGPATEPQPWTDDYTERLRYIAQFANTPMLRAQARAALRHRVRGGDIQ